MHALRGASRELPGLDEFASKVTSSRITQGIVVDLNPIWELAYRFYQAGLEPEVLLRLGPYWELGWMFEIGEELLGTQSPGWVDLGWSHPLVKDLTEYVFRRGDLANTPLLVKVIVLPISDSEGQEERRRLVGIAAEARFPAIVQTRPPARLAVACGDPCVASGSTGTIGGFLWDNVQKRVYAATCGHVVTAPGIPVSVGTTVIGSCSFTKPPCVQPSGFLCDPKGPGVDRLDLALIDVKAIPVQNIAPNVALTVHPHESVTMDGGTTGPRSYEIGGACLSYQVGGVCFGELFEVRPPVRAGVVSSKLATLIGRVPTSGDSGAWVLRGSNSDWCGVLVGADHLMGYALEADTVIAQANAEFSMDLVLA